MRVRFVVLAVFAVLAGCGFRSGIDTSSFEMESFALDQTSYVQGEPGTATATFRNIGPRPAVFPALSLSLSEPEAVSDFTLAVSSAPEEQIPPQGIGTIVFTFESTQTAEPRAVSVKLKDAAGEVLGEQAAELLPAATLKVNALAFEADDFTCRGIVKPGFVVATVENIGASKALLSEIAISVQDGNVGFESHSDPENPLAIDPGASATYHMQIQAGATVPPGGEYALTWTAYVTDAVTGDVRGEPLVGHDSLFLTVHIPASFDLDIAETATTVSTGAPNAGAVQIAYRNIGTVEGRIDAAALTFTIVDDTTPEYSVPPGSATLPLTVAPSIAGDIDFANVTLSSATPTLGTTEVGAVLNVEDPTCGRSFQQLVPEVSRGSWVVE